MGRVERGCNVFGSTRPTQHLCGSAWVNSKVIKNAMFEGRLDQYRRQFVRILMQECFHHNLEWTSKALAYIVNPMNECMNMTPLPNYKSIIFIPPRNVRILPLILIETR